MQKYRCYGKDDLGYPYDALSITDENGDWYLVDDVDARIAELERHATVQYHGALHKRIAELETHLRRCAAAIDLTYSMDAYGVPAELSDAGEAAKSVL